MSNQTTFDKIDILGIEVDVVNVNEAIDYIIQRSNPGLPPGYVAKPYVEFFDRGFADLEVQTVLNEAEMVIADGVAVQWAGAYLYAGPHSNWRWIKTLGQIVWAPKELCWPIAERASGVNFTWPLLEAAAQAGRKVAIVGTPSHGNIQLTAETIQARLPRIKIVLAHSGTDENSLAGRQSRGWLNQLAMEISRNQADIILLGLGFPRQEFAASYLSNQLKHGICIGEGGTFDYTSFGGRKPKAPVVLQRIGVEWLWRLALEPSRWRRQLAIVRFVWRIRRSHH